MTQDVKRVLVVGGAGYVGSNLVPKLLDADFEVNVLDLYIYGEDIFEQYKSNSALREFKGDIRSSAAVEKALQGCDAVIHLACISNDPSFELDPELGKSINYDSFRPLVKAAKDAGISRFIFASSSSVYGIKEVGNVTEDMTLEPLTDYSKFKVMCEEVLDDEREPGFSCLSIRPATVCGFAKRQRLDVIVNILTTHAVCNRKIKVFGGAQLRPNIHIDDMTDLYVKTLGLPASQIDGRVYNAGYENHPVSEIAEIVRGVVGDDVGIEVVPTDDNRSYHISSEKVAKELGFVPQYTIEDAARGLKQAFDQGLLTDPLTNEMYFNIKRMQSIRLN